ncbi:c6 finger domain protein [Diplodia corticola]|uniref:C6 finger domain protein n=1 Tax=Diplodia corticola TaxID=236234 RepID=A0A1J9RL40_9PEZI|nr:c6 finger domain protein [Diplodia corticola]OJD33299.1 c6 finger domain protein [Diplodia corticola]
MASMPREFETQLTTECNLNETGSDMTDSPETPAFSDHIPFTFGQSRGTSDVEDTTEGSADDEEAEIDIFKGNSLFGGGETEEKLPDPAPFGAADASPTLAYDPVLDPRLGTQIPSSPSPYDYYGSAEDNEKDEGHGGAHSRSETPEDFGRGYAKYEFRDRDRAVTTTHLDWDNSGNYDPADEGRRTKRVEGAEGLSGNRKRRSGGQAGPQDEHQLDEVGEPRQKKQKAYSSAYARFIGASYVFTVSLKSEAGRALAAKYQGEDNWPEDEYNFVSDEYIAQNLVASDGEDGGEGDGRRKLLRPRKRHVRYHSPGSDHDLLPPIADPLGIEDDLRYHPAARGCAECRIDGKLCSLRRSDATWPCLACQEKHTGEDVVPCELIILPTKKTACEACHEADKYCSYNDASADVGIACRQCEEQNLLCIAGPDLESLPKRATYTPPPGLAYTPYRPFVACTACRQVKRSCSLKSKQDTPPCRACEKAGIPCTFEKLVATNAGKQKAAPNTAAAVARLEENDRPAASDGPVRTPGGSVVSPGIPAPASNSFGLPLRTTSTGGSIGSLTQIFSSSSSRRSVTHPARSNPVAGLTTIVPPSKMRHYTTTTTPLSRRHTTSTGITTFRSGSRTLTDAGSARHRAPQQQQQQQTTPGSIARDIGYVQHRQKNHIHRKTDTLTHLNPTPTPHHHHARNSNSSASTTTTDSAPYHPPAAADIPASYHLLPPPGCHPTADLMLDAHGRKGWYREMVTALAHPMAFETDDDNTNANTTTNKNRGTAPARRSAAHCPFCATPWLGIAGLAWKKAAVLAWRDGRGFTEIAGGHASSASLAASAAITTTTTTYREYGRYSGGGGGRGEVGAEADVDAMRRMCRACVAERLDVLGCAGHEMESLVAADLGSGAGGFGGGGVARDAWVAEMVQRLDERRVEEGDRWCAVCRNPAVWRCCSLQEEDEDEDEEDEDEFGLVTVTAAAAGGGTGSRGKEGCGLLLCDDCKELWEMRGRDLQLMLEEKLSTERGVMKCRADAGFLLEEGLLMKNVEAQLLGL